MFKRKLSVRFDNTLRIIENYPTGLLYWSDWFVLLVVGHGWFADKAYDKENIFLYKTPWIVGGRKSIFTIVIH